MGRLDTCMVNTVSNVGYKSSNTDAAAIATSAAADGNAQVIVQQQTKQQLHEKGEQLMKQSLRTTKTERDPTHTQKWMQNTSMAAPVDLINAVEPIPVKGSRVCCNCGESLGGLGAPKTFYNLHGSTKEKPVVCKYCGLRSYSTGH